MDLVVQWHCLITSTKLSNGILSQRTVTTLLSYMRNYMLARPILACKSYNMLVFVF